MASGYSNSAFNDVDLNEGLRPKLRKPTDESVEIKDEKYMKITKSGKMKYPRRLIHCSDGILEEYSTDEEDEEEEIAPVVDPKTLTWGPYMWYQTVRGATGTLAVCDFLGEKLAWFFGITTPKFQSAISEIERIEEERLEQEALEKAEREAELAIIKEHVDQKIEVKVHSPVSDEVNKN